MSKQKVECPGCGERRAEHEANFNKSYEGFTGIVIKCRACRTIFRIDPTCGPGELRWIKICDWEWGE